MGLTTVSDNACSFNGFGGIILNSAVNNTISMNTCDDNPGGGILLYNDPGQVGSTGNLVTKNWVCNVAYLDTTQTFGIKEFNQSGDNLIVSNVILNDTAGPVSLVGTNSSEAP